jgi:hypothetical protein
MLRVRFVPVLRRTNVKSREWVPWSGRGLVADDLVGLRALLTLNDVKFYFVAFFQTFVSIDLYGAVVYKNVRSIVASDKAVPLCVVKPFDLACVLSHEPYPSLGDRLRLGDRAANLPD